MERIGADYVPAFGEIFRTSNGRGITVMALGCPWGGADLTWGGIVLHADDIYAGGVPYQPGRIHPLRFVTDHHWVKVSE